MTIDELITLAGEQPTRVSRRSGVSRSTLKRVKDGTSEPTLSTLREVALALGLDVTVTAGPASDPFAAAAARTLIDDSVPENPEDSGIVAWLDRFERWNITDPLTLVAEAGIVQGITRRPGARFVATDPGDLAALPDLFAVQDTRWALSGAATATVIMGRVVEGPTVVWHEGGDTAFDFGTPVAEPAAADVILVPAGATELAGHYTQGPLNFVAPVQLVIDLHSLGMYEEAEFLTSGWRS
ncbi:helix-turn-helix domain-containing protein [Corynebacterium gallinarum]|uniref:XRE family transcriptional regulator n=1 Tax=Corynebacterium gallinarum TaxID=2762214 RepID=A0A8I0HQ28_9CORY|nr:helix-turn-helix transcriptional regulator [Corynebacterium gallinarum]MBD8030143.1 XRE family transcriptional regulator [Corynebacterium gallinarum]